MLNFYKTIFYLFFVFYFFLKSPTYPTPAYWLSGFFLHQSYTRYTLLYI